MSGEDNDTDAVKEDTAGVIDEEDLVVGHGVLADVEHQYEETVQKIVDNDERVEYGKFSEGDQISPVPMGVYFKFPWQSITVVLHLINTAMPVSPTKGSVRPVGDAETWDKEVNSPDEVEENQANR